MPTEGDVDIRLAGIGGLSELIGWTEVQQEQNKGLGSADGALKVREEGCELQDEARAVDAAQWSGCAAAHARQATRGRPSAHKRHARALGATANAIPATWRSQLVWPACGHGRGDRRAAPGCGAERPATAGQPLGNRPATRTSRTSAHEPSRCPPAPLPAPAACRPWQSCIHNTQHKNPGQPSCRPLQAVAVVLAVDLLLFAAEAFKAYQEGGLAAP